MNHKFTHQVSNNFFSLIDNVEMKKIKPGKQVIFYIRQFARAYHVEDKLPQALNGIILN